MISFWPGSPNVNKFPVTVTSLSLGQLTRRSEIKITVVDNTILWKKSYLSVRLKYSFINRIKIYPPGSIISPTFEQLGPELKHSHSWHWPQHSSNVCWWVIIIGETKKQLTLYTQSKFLFLLQTLHKCDKHHGVLYK